MFNIDTIELISEYNVYQELLMAYEKQIMMEAYLLEAGETASAETAKAGIGASIKSGAAKAGSAIKFGGKKLGKGLLNLLKKGYDLFVRFLNKLKQMFANIKKKLIDRPWFDSSDNDIKITDKRVLELIKSKYKNLIFDESGMFIQTTGARDLRDTKEELYKINSTCTTKEYRDLNKYFLSFNNLFVNDRTVIPDEKIDKLNKGTAINKKINDSLNKIVDKVNNSKPVELKDIVGKSDAADQFSFAVTLIGSLTDIYDTFESKFKETVEFFEDKYGLHENDDIAVKDSYNKALKAVVDHLNVITSNLKLCLELGTDYNLQEYSQFIHFLYEGDNKQFRSDYHQYKSEKRSEQRKADKEKFDKKMDDFKSKFKKKNNKDDE